MTLMSLGHGKEFNSEDVLDTCSLSLPLLQFLWCELPLLASLLGLVQSVLLVPSSCFLKCLLEVSLDLIRKKVLGGCQV